MGIKEESLDKKYPALEKYSVSWMRGDFARGQRQNPDTVVFGSFGDVDYGKS